MSRNVLNKIHNTDAQTLFVRRDNFEVSTCQFPKHSQMRLSNVSVVHLFIIYELQHFDHFKTFNSNHVVRRPMYPMLFHIRTPP